MKKYVIEREIPGIGASTPSQLCAGAETSNEALAQLAPDVQWVHSYVVRDRTFCIYLARDESLIRQHAELSGFPATRIHEVCAVFDPSAATAIVAASAKSNVAGSAKSNVAGSAKSGVAGSAKSGVAGSVRARKEAS